MLTTGIQYSAPEDLGALDRAAIEDLHRRLSVDERVHSGRLIANYQIPGALVADCDVLLLLNLRGDGGAAIEQGDLRASFQNLFFLIELKQSERCLLREGAVMVEYASGKQKNATYQNKQAVDSLIDFLGSLSRSMDYKKPHVYGAVFLPRAGALQGQLHPAIASRALFGQPLDLDRLLRLAFEQRRLQLKPGVSLSLSSWPAISTEQSVQTYDRICAAIGAGAQTPVAGVLDRRRIEQITSNLAAARADYLDQIGSRMILFKGMAGTGKTTRLLQLAEALRSSGSSSLFLTYNRALARDIQYIQTILAGAHKRAPIPVETIGGVIYNVAVALSSPAGEAELLKKYACRYDEGYTAACAALLTIIEGEDASAARQLARESVRNLDCDFYLIDEGQDWSPPEMRVIQWLAGGAERLAVAVGPDQVQREHRADWSKLDSNPRLALCPHNLRQKPALHRFNFGLSQRLGEAWPENELHSDPGAVHILPDTDLQHADFWDELEARLLQADVSQRDVLIAEPGGKLPAPSSVDLLTRIGRSFWDGADPNVRRGKTPLLPEQYRILKYESTRGLECWVAILRLIDEQANLVVGRSARRSPRSEDALRKTALRDLRVSTTRAMDTLIITYHDERHWAVRELKREG